MKKHQHGGDIYTAEYEMDYSANINPLGTPESVIKAAQEAVFQSASYPDTRCGKLRKALAEKEGLKEDCIICGNGAAELIFSLAAAVKPKKAVLVSPGFAEYEQALKAQGCEIVFYELLEKNGFAVQEDYLELLTEDVELIFFCNPNNPTGVLTDRKFLVRIAEKCREKEIRMVLDSCFLEFLEDRKEADMREYLQEFPCLFILKAFTKIYAMAGLRLGYGLCADRELLERMQEVVQPWSVSIPAQAAGVAALLESGFAEESESLIRTERKWLKQKLLELGFQVYDSRANYIFFQATEELGEKCARQGILIRDCSNYRGLSKGFYRIAVRTREENRRLIEVMEGKNNGKDGKNGKSNYGAGDHVECGKKSADGWTLQNL